MTKRKLLVTRNMLMMLNVDDVELLLPVVLSAVSYQRTGVTASPVTESTILGCWDISALVAYAIASFICAHVIG